MMFKFEVLLVFDDDEVEVLLFVVGLELGILVVVITLEVVMDSFGFWVEIEVLFML